MVKEKLIKCQCNLRKKEARFMVISISDTGSPVPLTFFQQVNECLDTDAGCASVNCKFARGKIDPLV